MHAPTCAGATRLNQLKCGLSTFLTWPADCSTVRVQPREAAERPACNRRAAGLHPQHAAGPGRRSQEQNKTDDGSTTTVDRPLQYCTRTTHICRRTSLTSAQHQRQLVLQAQLTRICIRTDAHLQGHYIVSLHCITIDVSFMCVNSIGSILPYYCTVIRNCVCVTLSSRGRTSYGRCNGQIPLVIS